MAENETPKLTMAENETPKLTMAENETPKLPMAENETPKLTRKASKARLHKTASRLSIDAKFKNHHNEDPEGRTHNVNEAKNEHPVNEKEKPADDATRLHAEKAKDKDAAKKTKKGKKKAKGRHEVKEERKEGELKKAFWSREEAAAAKRESFQNCVFDKVKAALDIACKDGVTYIDIDNITPLMKCLDISTASESFVDLIRHAIIENSCEIVPLELDALVMEAQEANELVDVDECVQAAFRLLDFDDDGFITQKDIKELLQKLGEQPGDYSVDQMLEAADADKDDKISLSDFRQFLMGRIVSPMEETETKAGNVRELSEAMNNVKSNMDSHEVKEDDITGEGSNMADKIREKTFNKIRSVISGLKPTRSKHPPVALSEGDLTAVGDHALRSNVDSIQEEQNEAETNVDTTAHGNQAETIYSPRTLESVNRKRLFYGGFINNDRHFQPVLLELLQTNKNDNNWEIENRYESIDRMKEGHAMAVESRRSSVVQNQEVNKVPDSVKACILESGSSVDTAFTEDIGAYNEDRVWDDGPMPLELEYPTLHLPPPYLSQVDVSHVTVESTRIIAQQKEQRHDNTGTVVSLSEVGGSEIVLEEAKIDHPRTGTPKVNQRHAQDEPPQSYRVLDDDHALNAVEDVHDFNSELIFELRSGRKSSNCPTNALKIGNNNSCKQSDSLTNVDKEGTDSDEGIELVDEEIVQRTVHIPVSPKPSSASLRIYLPRGGTVYSNTPPVGKTSHSHDRSRITIDLHGLALKGDENKKGSMSQNDNTRFNSRISMHIPKRDTKYEYSGVNFKMNSPNINDSSFEDAEDQDVSCQRNVRSNSPESITTIFSARSNESVCNSESDSFTLLNENGEFHNWCATEETALTKPQIYDTRHEYGLPTPPNNPRITPSPQRKSKTPRTMTFNLKYHTAEAGKLEDNLVTTSHEIVQLQKQGMSHKDGYQLLAGGRTGEEKHISDVYYNHTPPWGFPARTHTETLNPALNRENPSHVRTTKLASKQSEPAKYVKPFSHENQIFAPREQTITIPASSLKYTRHRRLQRSRTSFELPVGRETEVAPKTNITDPAKPLPKKRSFSASASRFPTTSATTKPQYISVSVLDLTKSLQTSVSINKNKNNSLTNNHYEISKMIPLSRILNGSQANRHGYQSKLDYSVFRNIDKSGVPYFVHSSTLTKVLPPDTKTHQKKRKTRNTRKLSDTQGDSRNNDVTTLVGDYIDPDMIPNDVIFDNVNAFTRNFYKR